MILETLTPETEEKEDVLEDELPEDEKDAKKLKQRKPPADGPCKRCGKNVPLNRLMLCYPCWVKTELEKRGWREGEPHPDECGCQGVDGHSRLSDGN